MSSESYTPPPEPAVWRRDDPAGRGLDPAALAEAAALAAARETPWSRDIASVIAGGYFEPPPDNEVLGPVAPRGGPAGLVLHDGVIVAEWGDTARPDMTFSVAKSYLGLVAGLAVADGLLPDLDAPVFRSVADPVFAGERNGAVTWRHLLQQTSEWEGSLWGKAERIDRGRDLALEGRGAKGAPRPLGAPGSRWEYNDVRVNVLAYALLRLFRRPLPEVFAERIMRPIGASADWRWEGYRTSIVELHGRRVASVSGGGHWGGGVFIGARDQARIGLLVARGGVWGEKRLLPANWIAQSAAPSPLNPEYGFLWWLNTGRARLPSAPAHAFSANGAGGNLTFVDRESRLVVVLRWTDPAAFDAVIARVYGALA